MRVEQARALRAARSRERARHSQCTRGDSALRAAALCRCAAASPPQAMSKSLVTVTDTTPLQCVAARLLRRAGAAANPASQTASRAQLRPLRPPRRREAMKTMLAKGVSGVPVLNAAGKLVRGRGAPARCEGAGTSRAPAPALRRPRPQVGVLSETDILWKEAGLPQARSAVPRLRLRTSPLRRACGARAAPPCSHPSRARPPSRRTSGSSRPS
jgi:hypothetical protein